MYENSIYDQSSDGARSMDDNPDPIDDAFLGDIHTHQCTTLRDVRHEPIKTPRAYV